MTAHRQVWAKVNAPVDEGVRELVEALSAFVGVQTIESCQEDMGGRAWVAFYVGADPTDWQVAAELVLGRIGPTLADEFGDLAEVSLRVTEVGFVQGELTVSMDTLRELIHVLYYLAIWYTRPPAGLDEWLARVEAALGDDEEARSRIQAVWDRGAEKILDIWADMDLGASKP